MFQIDTKSRKSIYEQVVDNFKEQIIRGILSPGERIPSVRELSKILLINPNTVQKAYKELERQGYIYTSSGLGTFVSEIDSAVINMDKYREIVSNIRFLMDELRFLGMDNAQILKTVENLISEEVENHD